MSIKSHVVHLAVLTVPEECITMGLDRALPRLCATHDPNILNCRRGGGMAARARAIR